MPSLDPYSIEGICFVRRNNMKKTIQIKDKENNVYYKNNPKFFDELVEIVNAKRSYSKYIKFHRKDLYEFILKQTNFLDTQGQIELRSRLHCIFNNITEILVCKTCGKKQLDMRNIRLCAQKPRFCSRSCVMLNSETQNKIGETMLERYGVKHALQNSEINNIAAQHRKETNLERYGVPCAWQNEAVQRKKEQTNLERYGVKCTLQSEIVKNKIKQHNIELYGVEHHMQNKEIYNKSRKTCEERYGDAHPIRTQPIKDKLNQTNRELYGVDWTFQSDNNKEKSKITCQEKYGVDYALQSPKIQQKIKNTLYKNHNVTHNSQISGIRQKMSLKYTYDGYSFDSSVELCFYIWLKDHNIDFEYQPAISFEYIFNNVVHKYCPDFKIGNTIYEIKGDHFFQDKNPLNKMICPWDRSQDDIYEAKHQCMLKNNVIILTECDYKQYIHYVKNVYGSSYVKQFKHDSNNV